MAEKKTIELELKPSGIKESTEQTKSLKSQLKELKEQIALTADGSDEFKRLTKEAGALQDRIDDVNRQVKNFASDTRRLDVALEGLSAASGAFQAFEGTMALVGVESEDLQKTMVKLQAVMAVTNGIQSVANALNKDSALTFALNTAATKAATIAQSAYNTVIGASSGVLKAFKVALAATGIGLFVAALGTIVAYWDDIKAAVSGVSEEQKKLNKDAEKNAATAKETYDSFQLQENSLRLQGKTEKEILKLKIDKLNTSIKTAEVEIKNLEETSKLEVEAAKRNQEITKSIIQGALNFGALGLRLLVAPIDMVLETANLVSEKLGFGKIVATNLNKEITKLIDAGADIGSKFLFDPAKVKADSDATIKAAKQGLAQMKSDRDGFLIQLKQGDQQSTSNQQNNQKERLDLTRQRIDKEIELMEDGYEKEKRILEERAKREKEDLAESIKGKIVDQEEYAKTQKLIEDNLKKDLRELNSKYFDGELKARDFSIEALKNSKIKELEVEIEANEKKARIQKEYDEKEKARIKQLNQDKLQLAKDGLQLVSDLASLFGQQDEKKARLAFQVDKAAKISSATIAGYEAVLEAYKTGQKSPLTAVFPAYPYIQAGLAGAFAAVNIAKIAKSKFDSSGGGGGSMAPSGGGGGAAPMTANFSTIGSSGINQLAQLQQKPTQAYVVSGEVTSAQALDRNRVQNATL